jgi:hypothetical protein
MPFPCGISLPHAKARVLALMQHYCDRPLTPHRPHVSLSEVLPPAFASCGIPHDTPCGWHLLMLTHESTCRVTRFPAPIDRILRTVLSTGFLWQCMPVSGFGCRRSILCHFLAPAPQPLALVHGHDGSIQGWPSDATFAFAAHRCLLDGIPGLRLPGSAVYPRFRPLRTSRRPGGYAVTPALGGRGLHSHGS